jgi:hypothetical protein
MAFADMANGVCRHGKKQRVAVRRGANDRFGGDIAAGAGPVVDDELLAQPRRQPISHHAGDDVGRAAGGDLNDQAHRPCRIGLRPSEAR